MHLKVKVNFKTSLFPKTLTLTSPKTVILICVCVKITTIRKQQNPRSFNKNVYCVDQFAFIWYFFQNCSFYSFWTIIFCKTSGNTSIKAATSLGGEWVCPVAVYIDRSLKFGPYITCICLITKSLNVIIT